MAAGQAFGGFGEDFPDLEKAQDATSLTDLLEHFQKQKKQPVEAAQKAEDEINNQRKIDFNSFVESQPIVLERGNRNSCADQKQFASIATQQAEQAQADWASRATPYDRAVRGYGSNPNQTKLPPIRSAGAIRAGAGAVKRPNPASFKLNQGRALPAAAPTTITTVEPTFFEEKGKGNYQRFVQAQAGKRGTSLGDRAVHFTRNGTPLYGDTILDRSAQDNLSANQAAAAPPITAVPSNITAGKKLPAKTLARGKVGDVHPKGDSVTAMAVIGLAVGAITLVMLPLQYFINFFTWLLQVQTAVSNIRNIATSTTAFFSNTAYLLGFGKDALTPVEKSFDGMLNSVFGKEKVDIVKLEFAKLSVAVTAAVNVVDAVRDASDALGSAVTKTAQNLSKTGNALKAAGVLSKKFDWLDEKISASRQQGTLGQLNQALATTGTVSNALREITSEIKEAADEAEELEKKYIEDNKAEPTALREVLVEKYGGGKDNPPPIRQDRI